MVIESRPSGAPATGPEPAVLLFDGFCNLCASAVRFVLPRDCHERLRFASLQSPIGRDLLREAGMPELAGSGEAPETVVLISGSRAYVKSSAALRVATKLCRGWPLFGVFLLIPTPLRDLAYQWVARNRYRWFGRRDSCYVPTRDVAHRFLDASPGRQDLYRDP